MRNHNLIPSSHVTFAETLKDQRMQQVIFFSYSFLLPPNFLVDTFVWRCFYFYPFFLLSFCHRHYCNDWTKGFIFGGCGIGTFLIWEVRKFNVALLVTKTGLILASYKVPQVLPQYFLNSEALSTGKVSPKIF